MNREEVLAKSREENGNKDIYEQEVLKVASRYAVLAQMILATVFFIIQIIVGKGINWGLYALVYSSSMVTCWVKYIKLRRNHELAVAILYTMLVFVMSGFYIYNLIASSAIL